MVSYYPLCHGREAESCVLVVLLILEGVGQLAWRALMKVGREGREREKKGETETDDRKGRRGQFLE